MAYPVTQTPSYGKRSRDLSVLSVKKTHAHLRPGLRKSSIHFEVIMACGRRGSGPIVVARS